MKWAPICECDREWELTGDYLGTSLVFVVCIQESKHVAVALAKQLVWYCANIRRTAKKYCFERLAKLLMYLLGKGLCDLLLSQAGPFS